MALMGDGEANGPGSALPVPAPRSAFRFPSPAASPRRYVDVCRRVL